MILLVGWLGILTELGAIVSHIGDNNIMTVFTSGFGATVCWLANPIMMFALIILQVNSTTAFKMSILSTALILSFLAFNAVINDEAGNYRVITELRSGYWLWFLSSLTLCVGSLVGMKLTSFETNKAAA